jgi:hypothetical protein
MWGSLGSRKSWGKVHCAKWERHEYTGGPERGGWAMGRGASCGEGGELQPAWRAMHRDGYLCDSSFETGKRINFPFSS